MLNIPVLGKGQTSLVNNSYGPKQDDWTVFAGLSFHIVHKTKLLKKKKKKTACLRCRNRPKHVQVQTITTAPRKRYHHSAQTTAERVSRPHPSSPSRHRATATSAIDRPLCGVPASRELDRLGGNQLSIAGTTRNSTGRERKSQTTILSAAGTKARTRQKRGERVKYCQQHGDPQD